jgi:hypothetical protein
VANRRDGDEIAAGKVIEDKAENILVHVVCGDHSEMDTVVGLAVGTRRRQFGIVIRKSRLCDATVASRDGTDGTEGPDADVKT